MSTILDSLQKSSEQRDDNKQTIDGFSFADKNNNSKKNSLLIVVFFTVIITAYLAYDYWQSSLSDDPEIAVVTNQTSKKAMDKQDAKPAVNPVAKQKTKIDKPNNQDVKQKIREMQLNKSKGENTSKALNREKEIVLHKPAGKEQTLNQPQSHKLELTLEENKQRS